MGGTEDTMDIITGVITGMRNILLSKDRREVTRMGMDTATDRIRIHMGTEVIHMGTEVTDMEVMGTVDLVA